MSPLKRIFPPRADNNYRGSKVSLYVFYLLMALYSFRSLVHFFKDDSGVNSIASFHVWPIINGLDPNTVIYLYSSLWGGQQLVTLMLYIVALLRYRNLLPLMWLTVVIEIMFRAVSGLLHPLGPDYYTHTPPGSLGNLPLFLIACAMLALSLRWRTGN